MNTSELKNHRERGVTECISHGRSSRLWWANPAITNHFLRFAKVVTEPGVGPIDTLERGILEI